MGGDFINHSLAPEATLAREIGACFVNCAFVTAAYPSYFSPPQVNVLGEGVQVSLAPIASRIALQSVANFPIDETQCACSQLRSEQDASHYNNR
jgi:5'-methylthioadenosine phosphorylase